MQNAIDALPAEWAEIEVLVNNAGLSRGLDKLYVGKIEDWEEMIDTNVKGLLYVSRAVVPGMVVRGRGHVVNLGSTAGEMTYPGRGGLLREQGGGAGDQRRAAAGFAGNAGAGDERSIRGWWRRISAWCGFTAMRSGRRRCTRGSCR